VARVIVTFVVVWLAVAAVGWAADELRALYHALTVEPMANAPAQAELRRIRSVAHLAASD
jgi:hypothetical protein